MCGLYMDVYGNDHFQLTTWCFYTVDCSKWLFTQQDCVWGMQEGKHIIKIHQFQPFNPFTSNIKCIYSTEKKKIM